MYLQIYLDIITNTVKSVSISFTVKFVTQWSCTSVIIILPAVNMLPLCRCIIPRFDLQLNHCSTDVKLTPDTTSLFRAYSSTQGVLKKRWPYLKNCLKIKSQTRALWSYNTSLISNFMYATQRSVIPESE
jgi:hypothetical protein